MGRPRLLFVAPAVPSDAGNGLAMRAGLFLDALSRTFDVVLLVVPVAGSADRAATSPFVSSRAVRTLVASVPDHVDPPSRLGASPDDPDDRHRRFVEYPQPLLTRFATGSALRAAAALVAGEELDIVHVMRLYLAPFARPFLEDGNARRLAVLDLDDDEVETHARMAALHARLGNRRAADLEASDSVRYARFEREWLPRFDRLIVCAGRDRDALVRRRGSLPIEIAPNAVKPLALPAAPARETGRARVLFVGTLNYFPNEDAVIWLADDILPRIRALTGRLVELDVVGRGPSEALRRLGDRELVRVHADVADVAPFYAAADVVVAPVRAGGGTRIKLLEAFAAGVPVVATAIGAEGLDVEPGRELLVADNPWTMAEACSRILSDPQLARGLADRAAQFVAAWHDWRRVSADISGLFDRLSRRSGPGRVVGAAG